MSLHLAGAMPLGFSLDDSVAVRFAFADIGLSSLFDLAERPGSALAGTGRLTTLTVPARVTSLTTFEIPADA